MSLTTNQIIRRNNIYGYLINCEYFNSLNMDRGMVGTNIIARICTSLCTPN